MPSRMSSGLAACTPTPRIAAPSDSTTRIGCRQHAGAIRRTQPPRAPPALSVPAVPAVPLWLAAVGEGGEAAGVPGRAASVAVSLSVLPARPDTPAPPQLTT